MASPQVGLILNPANVFGIFLGAVLVLSLILVIVLYLSGLRPLRDKSNEEAVRWMRDLKPINKSKSLNVYARDRLQRAANWPRRQAIIEVIYGAAAVVMTVWFTIRFAIHGTISKYPLYYVLMLLAFASMWFFIHTIGIIGREQLGICEQFLGKSDVGSSNL